MKNKIIYLHLLFIIFSIQIKAQDTLAFKFDNGIIVAFKSKTVPPASEKELAKLYQESGSFKPKDISSIQRTYTNDDEKIIFSYGIDIKMNGDNTFTVTFKAEKGSRVQYEDDKTKEKYNNKDYLNKNLPNYPSNIVVNDGDTIVLDILENPKTGGKIQDLIKITRENRPFDDYFSELEESKDFTLEDVKLQLANYKLYINGKLIKRPKDFSGISRFFGMEFNQYDKALVLTAVPVPGYDFKRVGVIDGNKMLFTYNGDKFEIVSTVPILGFVKKWNLWMMNPPRVYKDYKIPEIIGYITNSTNKIEDFVETKEKTDDKNTNPKMVFKIQNDKKP
ncbi:MAG TPA: hypothetical protein PKY82_29465 [Pyrinomonadaceae bacterium]|nr:hypothetical protein [Pyrinomonadaceae bacterium]